MDVNNRTKLGESPGCAGVIEMNVTEKNVPHVVSRGADLPKRGNDIVKGRLWAGIKEHHTIVRFQRSSGDDARPG
jgi:hypothetical protein